MQGNGFFGDVGNWIKNAAIDTGKFVKDNRVLSTVAGFIPHPGAAMGSAVLRQAGLGKPRMVNRKPRMKY